MIYYDDIKKSDDKKYFDGYDFSKEIWVDNYKGPGEETIIDTWQRIAHTTAAPEDSSYKKEIEEKFFDALEDFKFVPGGRIMANLGIKGREGTTLFNCFVHHPKDINMKDADSIEGIYTLLKAQAHTLKSEGGYGLNCSFLRPAGSYVKGIGARTPGPLNFMELWDKSSEIITKGSDKIVGDREESEKRKIRKGAQMLVMTCFHPDIIDFIKAKQTPGRLTKFNMSVGITGDFMKAVDTDGDWKLRFPDTTFEKYKDEWFGDIDEWEEKKYPVIIYETIKARDLWDIIMVSTYKRNEPGVLFLDTHNKLNPIFYAEKIFTTNPCGEIGMSTGVCNLGSLNVVKFIKETKDGLEFDIEKFKEYIPIGIRFLDNILDISRAPLKEYKTANIEKRRIGLGTFGWGSLHYILGIRYGSKESLELVEKVAKAKAEAELLASAQLGKEKGSFPLFDKEKYFSSYWWKNLKISSKVKEEIEHIGHMRNSHHSMNAPTGNTSVYSQMISSGIEPVFIEEYIRWAIVSEYERGELKNDGFKFPDRSLNEWKETEHMKFIQRGDEQILKGTYKGTDYEYDKNRGLIKSVLIEDYGWKFAKSYYKDGLHKMKKNGIFATTNDLVVDDHINVLKIFAHYTNMAISKTVNIPNDYSFEEFKTLYLNAHKANIKGITTYRAGTMTAVLEEKKDSVEIDGNTVVSNAPKRPKILDADIYVVSVKNEKFVIAVGLLNNKPYEIFGGSLNGLGFKFQYKKGKIEKIKRGLYKLEIGDEIEVDDFSKHFTPTAQILFRLASTSLRHGVPIEFIVEQLQKSEDDMFSMSAAAARVLKKYVTDGSKFRGASCPTCSNNELIYQDGCISCKCGWSKCN